MTDETPVVAPGAVPTDDTLRRAVNGDEAAFVTLYLDLQPRLHRYALSLIGSDADDVTAEAWVQIVRDLGSFQGDLDAFRGWTARVLRNRAIDHARRRARRPVEALADTDVESYIAPDDTAEDALDWLATQDAVLLIAGLPRDQAEAVLLRAVVGLDAASVGLLLGKTPAAVRVAAHRGLKTLRRRLGSTRRGRSS